jgi:hypothetical protein
MIKFIYYSFLTVIFLVIVTFMLFLSRNFDSYQEFYCRIIEPSANNDFAIAISQILAAVIGIAIPISIATVSDHLKDFNDEDISKMFFEESIFRLQLSWGISYIGLAVSTYFFGLDSPLFNFVHLLLLLITLVIFYFFIRRVIQYSTETDNIIFERFSRIVDIYLSDEN